jgi:sugar phosphate permease
MLAAAVAGVQYPEARDAPAIVALVLAETVGWTLVGPAMHTLVARGSPEARLSTAQGIAGAAGTLGSIVASLIAGRLFELDDAYPFLAFSIVIVGSVAASAIVQVPWLLRRRRATPGLQPAGPDAS